jgi:hypothetical protein
MSGYCWRPVLAGLWRQHELTDGTYDFHDLVTVNIVLDIKQENDIRAATAAQERARRR